MFGQQFEELIPKDAPRWGPLPPKQVSKESKDTSLRSRRSLSLGRGRSGGSVSDTLPLLRYPPSDPNQPLGLINLAANSDQIPSERGPSSGSSWTFWPFSSGKSNDLVQVGGSSSGRTKGLNEASEAEEGGVGGLSRQASGTVETNEAKSSSSHPPLMRKTLTPTSEQLASLGLKPGRNRITYRIGTTALSAYVYLLSWDTKLVISDVDGTITKSDVLGHILPAIGWDWSHKGISQLFTNVVSHGYQIMYLSSRSIGQANITRDYLNTIVQKESGKGGGRSTGCPLGL